MIPSRQSLRHLNRLSMFSGFMEDNIQSHDFNWVVNNGNCQYGNPQHCISAEYSSSEMLFSFRRICIYGQWYGIGCIRYLPVGIFQSRQLKICSHRIEVRPSHAGTLNLALYPTEKARFYVSLSFRASYKWREFIHVPRWRVSRQLQLPRPHAGLLGWGVWKLLVGAAGDL